MPSFSSSIFFIPWIWLWRRTVSLIVADLIGEQDNFCCNGNLRSENPPEAHEPWLPASLCKNPQPPESGLLPDLPSHQEHPAWRSSFFRFSPLLHGTGQISQAPTKRVLPELPTMRPHLQTAPPHSQHVRITGKSSCLHIVLKAKFLCHLTDICKIFSLQAPYYISVRHSLRVVLICDKHIHFTTLHIGLHKIPDRALKENQLPWHFDT